MQSFLSRHHSEIQGSISGFDRLRLTGSLLTLGYARGLANVLSAAGVLLKDFGTFAESLSDKIKRATERIAQSTSGGRVVYLSSGSQSKEDYVRRLPRSEKGRFGLFAVLSCVEPCRSFEVRRNAKTKSLEIRPAIRKCLHVYFYMEHPVFGLMHFRLQTWLPMQIKICINGREWLARQLDNAGIGYLKKDNAFTYIENFDQAQVLLDQQLRVNWPLVLDELVGHFHPTQSQAFPGAFRQHYYWTTEQCEWATDVVFRSPKILSEWYPRLVHHGITTFSSRDILRFLQQKVPAHGGMNGNFAGEVVSDLKQRPEGIRIKHRCGKNSMKLYDKQGQVLRVETTIHDAAGLKAFRPTASDPKGPKQWQSLRKGVADLHRLSKLSHAANERYLDALSAVESTTPLAELSATLCRPVIRGNRRYRGMNPLSDTDAMFLETVQRAEFLVSGFRNRDLRQIIYGAAPAEPKARCRQSSRIGRMIALLRAHGLIKKVSGTHRYQVTSVGQTKLAAISAARKASIEKLTSAA